MHRWRILFFYSCGTIKGYALSVIHWPVARHAAVLGDLFRGFSRNFFVNLFHLFCGFKLNANHDFYRTKRESR